MGEMEVGPWEYSESIVDAMARMWVRLEDGRAEVETRGSEVNKAEV